MRRRSWRFVPLLVGAVTALIVVIGLGITARFTGVESTIGPEPLPTLDPAQVALGREAYLNNCASCHGANAQGAPNWTQSDPRGNLPPPPHDDTGHTWRHSDAELAQIIRNGQRDVFNKSPELTMPAFKDRLSDEEIAAVITYFRTLWSPEHRRYQQEQNQRSPMATPGNRG